MKLLETSPGMKIPRRLVESRPKGYAGPSINTRSTTRRAVRDSSAVVGGCWREGSSPNTLDGCGWTRSVDPVTAEPMDETPTHDCCGPLGLRTSPHSNSGRSGRDLVRARSLTDGIHRAYLVVVGDAAANPRIHK